MLNSIHLLRMFLLRSLLFFLRLDLRLLFNLLLRLLFNLLLRLLFHHLLRLLGNLLRLRLLRLVLGLFLVNGLLLLLSLLLRLLLGIQRRRLAVQWRILVRSLFVRVEIFGNIIGANFPHSLLLTSIFLTKVSVFTEGILAIQFSLALLSRFGLSHASIEKTFAKPLSEVIRTNRKGVIVHHN